MVFDSLAEVDAQDLQSGEGSQDESAVEILEPSPIVSQSEGASTQTSHQVPPPDIDQYVRTDPTFNPTHISIEPIDEVNSRWCVEGLQMIYE